MLHKCDYSVKHTTGVVQGVVLSCLPGQGLFPFPLPSCHYRAKKPTIHQVTTMLATSKNVLFPGHNHLPTTSTDNPIQQFDYRLSASYDLEIGHFSKWLAWWLPRG